MGNKEKGANSERELLHMFWEKGFAVIRAAGSGKLPEPSCDLIVGKGSKKFAIECKTSRKKRKYITKQQIINFIKFANIFSVIPLIAIKFSRQKWLFLKPEQLEDTGKGLAISLEKAEKIGKKFEQIVN